MEEERRIIEKLMEEELTAGRYEEGTKRLIRRGMREFMKWLGVKRKSIRKVERKDLMGYQEWISQKERNGKIASSSTVNGKMGIVKKVFGCAYRAGMIKENPFHGMSMNVKRRERTRRAMSRGEISQFLEGLEEENGKGMRDRSLYELIYSSGLRVSEAGGLKVGDIDFERRLMVVRGKFDKDRMVPVSEVGIAFLKRYLGKRIGNKEEWVYGGRKKGSHLSKNQIGQRFRQIRERLGLDKELTTHCIRHATATHLLENGASIRHVQELLGHRNIETTVRYTHVMVENVKREYRKYHPREHELYEEVEAEYLARLERIRKQG